MKAQEQIVTLKRLIIAQNGSQLWVVQQSNQEFIFKFVYDSEISENQRKINELIPKDNTCFVKYYGLMSPSTPYYVVDPLIFPPSQGKEKFYLQPSSILPFKFQYVRGGDLASYLRHYQDSRCKKLCPCSQINFQLIRAWASDLIEILYILRKCKIAHRDLNPRNILIGGDGHLKLGDFGISEPAFQGDKIISKMTSAIGSGTPGYKPPELLSPSSQFYPIEVDYYCFGLITFEMMFGCLPFSEATEANEHYVDFVKKNQQFWSKWKSKSGLNDVGADFMTAINVLLDHERGKRGNYRSLFLKKEEFCWFGLKKLEGEKLKQQVKQRLQCSHIRGTK